MLKKTSLALCVCAGLALLPGATAHAESSYTFYGSGWGHGIGLSQYGAYGLAKKGWDAPKILKHYYSGVQVEERVAPARVFRVGLVQRRRSFRFTAAEGSFRLILASGKVLAKVPQGGTARVTISGGRYVVEKPGGGIAKGGSAGVALRVRRATGAVVRSTEWRHLSGRGRLEVVIASASRGHLVAVVKPEQYLYGLGEVPSSWPSAALGAQAIAARTYAYRKIADGPSQQRAECACGILASTRDQYYIGLDKERAAAGGLWVAAVHATAKRVATYGGSPIFTYYSSSSGGFTENVENVWIGATPKAYLKGVCDPGDWVPANPNRTWSLELTAQQVSNKLKGLTGAIGTVTGFSDYSLGVSGRVKKVRVVGTSGSLVVEGWDLRTALGLKDTRFRVNQNRNVIGKIRTAYDALGCAPGVPAGAATAASGGRYQSFQQGRLYQHDARDQVAWVRGPALDKYLALGETGSPLGLPYQAEETAAGLRVLFDGGEIYAWSAGAFEVHGAVLAKYLEAGGHAGSLGYPTSDVTPVGGAEQSTFEHGTISCSGGTVDTCTVA